MSDLIEPNRPDVEPVAVRFERMAAQIRLNKDSNFAGAFVLVPPPGMGEPVDSLLINSSNASAMFWYQLKSIAEDMLKQVQDAQQRTRLY